MAPWASVFSGSTIRSGSKYNSVPIPWQAGHAPRWLLKEVLRGQPRHRKSRSAIAVVGGRIFPRSSRRLPAPAADRDLPPSAGRFLRISKALRKALANHEPVHHRLDGVAAVLSSFTGIRLCQFKHLTIHTQHAQTPRAGPSRNTSRNSPFWLLTRAARSKNFVLSGQRRTASAISWRVWRETTRPVEGS